MTKEIVLTNGQKTIVDDDDYERLSQYTWKMAKPALGSKRRYVYRTVKGQGSIIISREIMNAPKGMFVDHINHDTLDNTKANLRVVTPLENQWNRVKDKNSKNKYKCVYWDPKKKKWRVNFSYNKKQIVVGYYDDEVDAAKMYDECAKKYYGEFAYLNLKG